MCSIPGLPTPGSEVPVLIKRVNLNPSSGLVELWVNMSDGRKDVYKQMREDIQNPERPFSGSEGKPGDLCLVCISGTWHRARIVLIQNESYDVFLIDQGRPRIITNEALAWGQSDSFLLPPEIESCILASVLSLEDDWPEKAKKFLKSLPGKKFRGLVQHVLMPHRMILLDIPMVSKHMCKLGVAKKTPIDEFKGLVLDRLNLPKGEASKLDDKPQEQNDSCKPEKRDQYFYPELLTDTFENVCVTEVINPQKLYCNIHIFSKAVKILSEEINQYYEEGSGSGEAQPQSCGDPCAAKGIKGWWHRSVLKQNMTSSGAVEVLHVDDGRSELVPVANIKPLHGKFLRMPVFTYVCSLEGVKDSGTGWTTDQTDYLKSLILNQMAKAKFERYDASQDIYYVTLHAANDECINDYFINKQGLLSASKTEQDVDVQKDTPSSSVSSIEEECFPDLQHKVKNNVHDSQEETLQSTNSVSVNSRKNGVHTSVIDDENSDHVKWSTGHLSRGFLPEAHYAHGDNVFAVGRSLNVQVSCIESLKKFWCQTLENCDTLTHLMQDLQNHYASPHPQSIVESICVARNPNNDLWHRARIIASENSPLVDVNFIDFGETQQVPLQDIRPIDPTFLRLNAQAFQCCLFDPENPNDPSAATWTQASIAEFHEIAESGASSNIGLKCVIKAVTSDDKGLLLHVVDMKPSGIVCKLLVPKQALAEACVQIPPQVLSDSYPYSTHNIELGEKEKVQLTYFENVHHFYCHLERNSYLFIELMENVEELVGQQPNTDHHHQPELNSICFVRNTDSWWFRGQVVETSPDLKVHLVDIGSTIAVNESDIRPVPTGESISRFLPVQAVPLGLFDVPAEVPQEVNQWFADNTNCHSLTISVMEKGQKGRLIVEVFNGSLNLNVKARDMILEMEQQKSTDLVQETEPQILNSSEHTSLLNGDCSVQEFGNISALTKMAEESEMHSSSSRISTRDELQMSAQSITVFSPQTKYGKTSSEERKHTLEVIPEEKETVLAETFIQSGHSDSENTKSSTTSSEENLQVCKYKRPNISLNKTEEVYASCIVDPHYFWCQFANTEELDKVSALAQEAGQAQHDMKFTDTLGPGSPCLALFSSDNQWYRAQVTHRTDNALNVVFLDYGNESDVNIKNVKPLSQTLLDKDPLAFLCCLNGFDESKGSWDDEVYEDFNNLLVDKPLKLTVFNIENHSEMAVPQCRVEIVCEEVNLNVAMQKYWKPVDKECIVLASPQTEALPQNGPSTSIITSPIETKINVNNCLYKRPNISKNKKEEVYASCIVEPHYFWCQFANTEELNKVSALAQEAGKTKHYSMFTDTLGPGSPCLALFSSDNNWYRAQVTEKADEKVHVVFMDYGNESDVDIKNVRPLPQSLLDQAPQAFVCSLNGFDVSKGSWKDEVYDDFYKLLVDKPLKLTVFNMIEDSEIAVPKWTVEIECEGVNVNVAMQRYWKPVCKESVAIESLQTKTFIQPNIYKNKTVTVYASCIDEPNYFWCQQTNKEEELNRISRLAQEAGHNSLQDQRIPETLGPGSPCLALFSGDKQWYRALVLHKADKTFHVVFIDYGNESAIEVRNVRPLPQSLLDQAPQALFCFLNGFDQSKGSWDEDVYDHFYSLLANKPLKLTVLNIESHSKVAVPHYRVEIESKGVNVNAAVRKYWKPAVKDCVSVESLQTETFPQDGQTQSNKTQLCVLKEDTNTCMFKEPNISRKKTERLMVYASCIVDPHYFWCQYANSEDELNKVSAHCLKSGQDSFKNQKMTETLGPGNPCLALFSSDNKWYRAQIIHRADEAFQVVFVDYGNESDVELKNVRLLPQSLLDKAPLAFLCCLNGFDKSKGSWNDDVYDDFYNLLVDKPLKLTVIEMGIHSEMAFPQYAVEIECEGADVNMLMKKYWKEQDTEPLPGRKFDIGG